MTTSTPPKATAAKTASKLATQAGPRTGAKPGKRPAGKRASGVSASSPAANWRVRVRMYRHGLGDCFLLSFRAPDGLHQVLIDCGALARNQEFMTTLAQEIRDHAIDAGRRSDGKARLDIVVATHEHKDHVSGFNQAREVFDAMDIASVWMSWAENLSVPAIKRIRETRRTARATLEAALDWHGSALTTAGLADMAPLLDFSADDDSPGDRTVAQAMEYLKFRGKRAGDLRFIEPGGEPFALPGVPGVRVYALGPPHDPAMLKTSAITEKMKREGMIYHLAATGDVWDPLESTCRHASLSIL